MIKENDKNILNTVYKEYEDIVKNILNSIDKSYKVNITYTNKYNLKLYPLPVMNIKNLCRIIFRDNEIDINTIILKEDVLKLDFKKFSKYDYDIYPNNHIYDDLYIKGMSNKELLTNIKKVKTKYIGFTFILPLNINTNSIIKLLDLLKQNNFRLK